MRPRLVAAGCAAGAAVVAVVVAATVASSDTGGPREGQSEVPTATATVTRGDMVSSTTVDGTLSYSGSQAVTGLAAGTITGLPSEGAVIERGGVLHAVDGRPVLLLYGTLPFWRQLSSGVEGPDVEQLERNLAELGYSDDLTVDEEYTAVTAAAVRAWQKAAGVERTGVVEPGDVVLAAGAVRVGEHAAHVGDLVAPGAELYELTSTERVVAVDLDVDDQALARKDAAVTIELPGGTTTTGRIVSVGTVVHGGDEEGDSPADPGSGDPSTIDVTVSLDDPAAVGSLTESPVEVRLESERRDGVLSVPVSALLALAGGGYGVEVVTGTSTRLVDVEVGMFADGRVEVSGDGVAEGTVVEVPAS